MINYETDEDAKVNAGVQQLDECFGSWAIDYRKGWACYFYVLKPFFWNFFSWKI